MDLLLWRHAEAIDLDLVGDDMARYLSPRGEKQAARMAAWLDRHLPDGARVLSSTAMRAEQTARALGRKFKTHAALAPLGTAQQLLDLAQWPQARGCVLVVGHQPTLGLVLAQLLGLEGGGPAVKKGAVWWLRLREREGVSETTVVTVQTPEML